MEKKLRKLFTLFYLLIGFVLVIGSGSAQTQTQILIIGGGASGTMAGIQAARMGAQVLIIEPTPWLGGMLTSAGVSAIDGNHRLPSGLWAEFRQKLYDHYGGPAAVETGWVSNTLFEPSVGNKVLKELAGKEKGLTVWHGSQFAGATYQNGKWTVTVLKDRKKQVIEATLLIDATELGDVLAAVGAGYRIGMDSRHETGEEQAPEKANDIIQDLTYVATLQDYGKGTDKTIPKPSGYDPAVFRCACDISDPATFDQPQNNCYKMMQYGRLPNQKYMINWPKCGNDFYLNFIEKTPEEREKAIAEAKLHTLRFVYYLQTELGYKHLGLARNEYPTKDGLPMIPYYRESRRLKGLVTLTVNHINKPYDQAEALYRTGVAIGDYPIDHHHGKNPAAPAIDFVKIRVPSYNVPLGSLIPEKVPGLIVAEKSISVTNIVNGATRLQPVVIGIGQAAGALAAVCVKNNQQPAAVAIREVQQALLEANVYLMPFIDVNLSDPHFKAIQRVGVAGILQGEGVPYQWANQTWFYPERTVSQYEILAGLRPWYPQLQHDWTASGESLTVKQLLEIFKKVKKPVNLTELNKDWHSFQLKEELTENLILNRRIAALLIDRYLDPFSQPVTFTGQPQSNNQ